MIRSLIGQTLGRYRVVELLGRGGMAEVYKALDPQANPVAVKILYPFLAQDDGFLARFRREADTIARLQHPHIVRIHDFDIAEDLPYIVMEYVPGGTLYQRLTSLPSGWGLPLPEALSLMIQICQGMDHAHRRGVIHRDLKPHNVLFRTAQQIVISDFSLAKIVGSTQYSLTGGPLGSPAYMAPEQAQGLEGDARSDVYAMGLMLFEMLTGRPAFSAPTPFGVLMKQIHEPLPSPRELVSLLPPALEQILFRATAKDPAQRFPSAAALGQVLRAVAEGKPVDGVAPPQPTAAIKAPQLVISEEPRRRRWGRQQAIAWILIFFLAAGALSLLAPTLADQEGTAPPDPGSAAALESSPRMGAGDGSGDEPLFRGSEASPPANTTTAATPTSAGNVPVAPIPTATPTFTATKTPTPTPTKTPTPTATPTPTFTATLIPVLPGKYALHFDGDDILQAGAVHEKGRLTVEAYIVPSTSEALIIVGADDNIGWSLELNGGQLTFWVSNGEGWFFDRHPSPVSSGVRYHLAATFENNIARTFLNGAASPGSEVGPLGQGLFLRMGGLPGFAFYSGRLDEVRISKGIRYSGSFSPPSGPLVPDRDTLGLWHFDEGSGQIAFDSSQSGNHATLGTSSGPDPNDPTWVGV